MPAGQFFLEYGEKEHNVTEKKRKVLEMVK
jgi:hypothetical protein